MKIAAVVCAVFGAATAFSPQPRHDVSVKSSGLQATVDRRDFAKQATAAAVIGGATLLSNASPALAGARGEGYVPSYDDLKQIYFLGMSLERLADKFSNEDTVESGLDGVRMFTKDISFYPGYAKNYISKSVLRNAEGDPRLGYIKQAAKLIASTEDVLDAGLADKASMEEAVKRVRKAQSLIGKFLAESGVSDDKVTAYIKAHPAS